MVATQAVPQTKSLPDGSQITLNRNSTIKFVRKLRGKTRAVELKGEAFFKVTPNEEKPFVIDVNDVTVTVLGTSFNVKGYNEQTEVVVETGTVKVESKGKSVVLKAGGRVTINKSDSTIIEQKSRDKLYNYYVTKEFVCDNTPLWKLVEVLNEAYNVRIEIVNPDLRELPLTTTFYNESLDNILNVISETFDITITRDGERIFMN
jgi:ferric-dicitrate binding protein FerR (iron transport regulator)